MIFDGYYKRNLEGVVLLPLELGKYVSSAV